MLNPLLVGVISDTHGLVRPQALAALGGVDLIVHAGDVGSPDVLRALGRIAPVRAVRGNVDQEGWAAELPVTDLFEAGGLLLYLLHDLRSLDLDPKAAGIAAVVSGHSHRPLCEARDGVLYLNPGSAGPRRFRLPITVGKLRIGGGRVDGEVVPLEPLER